VVLGQHWAILCAVFFFHRSRICDYFVKISGVQHEFSSIPGVVEDTTDLILNLKEIRLKLHTDKPKTLLLKAKGPGEVTAKDIVADAEVEILNPDLHLATIDKNGKLELEMRARRAGVCLLG